MDQHVFAYSGFMFRRRHNGAGHRDSTTIHTGILSEVEYGVPFSSSTEYFSRTQNRPQYRSTKYLRTGTNIGLLVVLVLILKHFVQFIRKVRQNEWNRD